MQSTVSGKIVTLREFENELREAYMFGDINADNVEQIVHSTYSLLDSIFGVTPSSVDGYLQFLWQSFKCKKGNR